MKKVLRVLFLVGIVCGVLLGFNLHSIAAGEMCSPVEVVNGGDIGPWPFGLEQPFPWKRIDGVWQAEMSGCRYYFVFKTTRDGRNFRRLKINQIEPNTCTSIADGFGVQQEDNQNVVSASVTGVNGPMFFSVHVFKESDIKDIRSKNKHADVVAQSNRNVTVLSVQSLTDPERVVNHYKLVKMADDLSDVCQRQ